MAETKVEVLAAGHLCLDIIPALPAVGLPLGELLRPGKLVDVGGAVLSTGGAASNTGLALHRLGFGVSIVGKVGDDLFGEAAVKILAGHAPALASRMIVAKDAGTSYSIILNPPGHDRTILHDPAANDTFRSEDVPDSVFAEPRLIHFGYPPLMRMFRAADGASLRTLFRRARTRGVATSLDMSRPDPDGESGRVDWRRYLENVLPETDVFMPSADELLYMLEPELFAAFLKRAGDGNPAVFVDAGLLHRLSGLLLEMGAAIVGVKLGDEGLYVRTTGDAARIAELGRLAPADAGLWLDQEILASCRQVEVAGTIGAGDCTIAGFLGGLLRGLDIDSATAMAVCAGGASVEAPDAHSGVPHWSELEARRVSGWPERPSAIAPAGWEATPAGNRARPAGRMR